MDAERFKQALAAAQNDAARCQAIERAVNAGSLVPYGDHQMPAFQLPERVTRRMCRRRLASWQAALGPIKHGWG